MDESYGKFVLLLLSQCRRHWTKWYALPLSFVLVAVAIWGIHRWLVPDLSIRDLTIGFVFGCLVIASAWTFSNRLPRAKRRSLGFAIALTYEDEHQAKRLRADFVNKLRRQLQDWHRVPAVSFLEISPILAEALTQLDESQLSTIASRCRYHFLITGTAKLRTLDQEVHVLELRALVRHQPISKQIQKNLAVEFTELFPANLMVSVRGDFVGMAFTAETLETIAKYIVGTASLLSNDYSYAADRFRELSASLKDEVSALESINKIRKRIPERLQEALRGQLATLSRSYTRLRDKKIVQQIEKVTQELDRLNLKLYPVMLEKAIVQFVLHRNIEEAKRILRDCRKDDDDDATWRWSLAFLLAYEGDLEGAYRTYQDAFDKPQNNDRLPVEVEEFIAIILAEEPDKKQLYFALGLINFRVKNDWQAARSDLELFVKWARAENKFPIQIEAAEKWLGEIRGERRKRGQANSRRSRKRASDSRNA